MSDVSIFSKKDKNFPRLLTEIPSCPRQLYVRGELRKEEHCLSIVGTRKPTRYGVETAEKIIRGLSRSSRLTIVSGLASGIDTVAHSEAVKNGLRTIAVLGSGIDHCSIFPPQNKNLADKIVSSGGAVISEYPEGAPGLPHHFPERNRIIAGLSLGTLVVEAKEKSGALITARLALEQNREVFAVPGSIFSLNSCGPHMLIKKGAKAVTAADDILEELSVPVMKNLETEKRDEAVGREEKIILTLLSDEPRSVHEIKGETEFSTSGILSALTVLELKGLVKKTGADQWSKI